MSKAGVPSNDIKGGKNKQWEQVGRARARAEMGKVQKEKM